MYTTFFRNTLSRSRPALVSAVGLFTSSNLRHRSTYLVRNPPDSAARHAPTPLVFLSSKQWDKSSDLGMTSLSAALAEKGFTCIQVDLAPPNVAPSTAEELMNHYEKELSYHIRLSSIPFPPVLIGRSTAGSLIAQTYLSSHPASGLILISPPTSLQSSSAALPTELKDFDYEPRFPLLILDHTSAQAKHEKENRLVRDWQVELISLDNLDGQEAFTTIETWLDESGF